MQRFDESQLLDLIEGELDAPTAAALRQRLAGQPRALKLIDKLCADRAALRSTPHPELPMDFLAQLEPLLARPMLVEPVPPTRPQAVAVPGAFRRQHRQHTRRIVWSRLAVAAMVACGVLAGLWAAISAIITSSTPPPLQAAAEQTDPQATSTSDDASTAATPPAVPLTAVDATIHHSQPAMMVDAASGLVRQNSDSPAETPRAGSSVPASSRMLPAEFALVVQTDDPAGAEQALQRALSELGVPCTLVRNFSFTEAQELERQWRLAQGSQPEPHDLPLIAQAGPHRPTSDQLKALADHVRERLKGVAKHITAPDPADQAPQSGGRLIGPAELSASLEQQLDFSSRGATYTIAVPAARLVSLMEQLTIGQGQATALRMLPSNASDPHQHEDWKPALFWTTEGPLVRQSVQRLAQTDRDAIVLLPVMVRTQSAKRPNEEATGTSLP